MYKIYVELTVSKSFFIEWTHQLQLDFFVCVFFRLCNNLRSQWMAIICIFWSLNKVTGCNPLSFTEKSVGKLHKPCYLKSVLLLYASQWHIIANCACCRDLRAVLQSSLTNFPSGHLKKPNKPKLILSGVCGIWHHEGNWDVGESTQCWVAFISNGNFWHKNIILIYFFQREQVTLSTTTTTTTIKKAIKNSHCQVKKTSSRLKCFIRIASNFDDNANSHGIVP